MRNLRNLALPLFVLAVAACEAGTAAPARTAADAVGDLYIARLDSLETQLSQLHGEIVKGEPTPASTAAIHEAFGASRSLYKRVEFLLEYYTPTSAEEINGPALPEVKEDDPNLIALPPTGFQVVEELLYPELDPAVRTEAADQTEILRVTVQRVAQYAAEREFSDENIWEAMRLEIGRIVALGISGFDSPVALRSVPEAREALVGLRTFASLYDDEAGSVQPLLDRIAAAEAFLTSGGDFDAFDRVSFIRTHVDPLTSAMVEARDALGVGIPEEGRAWNPNARQLFTSAAFDPHFFAAPGTPRPSAGEIELGRRLFLDPLLSGEGDRACSTCHVPSKAFTDGQVRSVALGSGEGAVLRNSPTMLNAALQAGSFADLKTAYLEDQISAVVTNRDEMHGNLDEAAVALRTHPSYAAVLVDAHRGGESALSGDDLQRALAAYVRTLVGMDSRFDRHIRGDEEVLTESEKNGFNLFMGKAKCGTCHFAPLFNGTVPPTYTEAEVEVLGVPDRKGSLTIDPDVGRSAVSRNPLHRHGFKTPTVRNVELTAPYMHNGAYATLEEVVDFYDAGGGVGLGMKLDNQTLPPDSLRLTTDEKRDLVAFMKSLTDAEVR